LTGGGSDQRRKAIIEKQFHNESLFKSIRLELKSRFSELAGDLQCKIQEAINFHLSNSQNDLDTLKNENAALEADRYPDFRRRVEAEVARVRQEMRKIPI
jgi:hypothetical protein